MCVIREQKLNNIHESLNKRWLLDAIAGRDKLMGHSERFSTKTLYKFVKGGIIDAKKLRHKGKNNSKNHKETRGRINDCKTIHERDNQYPKASTNQEYGHFEADTIVGKHCQSAIVTLVEKRSKYTILLKVIRKSQEVKETTLDWLNKQLKATIKTITFDPWKRVF